MMGSSGAPVAGRAVRLLVATATRASALPDGCPRGGPARPMPAAVPPLGGSSSRAGSRRAVVRATAGLGGPAAWLLTFRPAGPRRGLHGLGPAAGRDPGAAACPPTRRALRPGRGGRRAGRALAATSPGRRRRGPGQPGRGGGGARSAPGGASRPAGPGRGRRGCGARALTVLSGDAGTRRASGRVESSSTAAARAVSARGPRSTTRRPRPADARVWRVGRESGPEEVATIACWDQGSPIRPEGRAPPSSGDGGRWPQTTPNSPARNAQTLSARPGYATGRRVVLHRRAPRTDGEPKALAEQRAPVAAAG